MLRIPAVLSLALVLVPLTAQEKHTLRYTFRPGHVCWLEETLDMAQEVKRGEMDMKATQVTTSWAEAKTAEVKDGVATMARRYARVTAATDMNGQKSQYDSEVAGSKPSPMLAGLPELVGKSVALRVDTVGKVVEVSADEAMKKTLEKLGSSLQEGTEMSILSLPKDPVAVGDTWTSEQKFPMGPAGAMMAKLTHKLVGVKGKVATIESKMELDTSGVKIPGVQLVAEAASCAFELSLDDGLPLAARTEMVLKSTAESQMQMKMTIRQSTKQVPAPAPKKDAPKEASTGK